MAIPRGKVKALKLRPVKNDLPGGRRGYCGPTVLASITGRKLSVIMELIATKRWGTKHEAQRYGYVRGRVTGTSPADLEHVLAHYDLRMVPVARFKRCFDAADNYGNRPTLVTWCRARDDLNALYIVDVGFGARGGHWAAIKGRKFLDTYTEGRPVWLKDAPHRRKRVQRIWIVTHRE